MYINPFIAGILFTLIAEFTAAVVYSVYSLNDLLEKVISCCFIKENISGEK